MHDEDNELIQNWSKEDMCEVILKTDDSFLKIKETLNRIGVASVKGEEKTLYPSCHILHKKGKYYIVHFKELFALDGKPTDLTKEDMYRRNAIVHLLTEWNMLDPANPKDFDGDVAVHLKVLKFSEKSEWKIVPKYNIGNV